MWPPLFRRGSSFEGGLGVPDRIVTFVKIYWGYASTHAKVLKRRPAASGYLLWHWVSDTREWGKQRRNFHP